MITEENFLNCSAWLESEDDEVVARVNRRIGAVTGLEMSTAEPLQVKPINTDICYSELNIQDMSIILQVLIFLHENGNELEFNQSEKRAIQFNQPEKHRLPRPISQMNYKFSLKCTGYTEDLWSV